MKEQNTILKIMKNNRTIDFERFSQKTLNGVLKQYKKIKGEYRYWIMFEDIANCDNIRIETTNSKVRNYIGSMAKQANHVLSLANEAVNKSAGENANAGTFIANLL